MSATGALPSPTRVGFRIEPARFGVWLFLVTEAMFFAALISAFLVLRAGSSTFGGAGAALDVRLGAVATCMLIAASLCISRARVALLRGRDERIVTSWVRRTILFGTLFFCMQAIEYRSLLVHGLSPRTSLYWSSFFVLTSVHALHVLGGIAWLGVVVRGTQHGTHALGVQLAALYWHLVDVVWLVLFALFYL